jgi:hypothetical protein
MRYLVSLLCLLALPVAAQEYDDDTNQFKTVDPVPMPLPNNYGRCVKIIVHKEYRDKWATLYVFEPPLLDKEVVTINKNRHIGKVEHCDGAKS